jgi:deazaflavin-dependent oxidoreductase (nitroreductase family)
VTDRNAAVIDEFRSSGGKVAAFGKQPLLLLTHRGAKSATLRTNPLAYFRDGDRYVIVASKGGAPSNPDWYHNLVAHPSATVEVGTERFEVVAREVDGAERDRLWALITQSNRSFAGYEERTSRTIPVIVLERASLPIT